jgi:hypothetical protein
MTDDQSPTEQVERGPAERDPTKHGPVEHGSVERGREHVGWPTIGVRYVLPVAAVLIGAIIMALGSESDLEGGAGIVSAGLAIYAMNWLYRASFDDRRVRAEEEAARAYFSAHGRWPDETTGRNRVKSSRRIDRGK